MTETLENLDTSTVSGDGVQHSVQQPAAESAPKPQRTVSGQFLPGNTVARRHGMFAERVSEALVAEREAYEAASIADDGADVPVRRASRHRYRARVHIQIEALSNALEHFGLFDKRNRLRTAWLQRLEGLIATAQRLDASLGDERRAKDIGALSSTEYAALRQGSGA